MTDAGREPVDLASLHAADALFDRLATRTPDTSAESDSTVRLLRALLEDVDGRPDVRLGPPLRGTSRRAACTTAAMGVAAAVLATTGVAAATGGWTEPTPKQASVHSSKPAADPGPPLEPAPSPAVAQAEVAGLGVSQPAVARPADIREYLRRRLDDGTWR